MYFCNSCGLVEGLADFSARRSALVKALTDDADVFFRLCDPDAGSALYLMGESNGRWNMEVEVPTDVVPPEIPQKAVFLIRRFL
ncbi:hypothetical protein K1719_018671 [Acacia pycnantha]|nr:hypothetical protein K1719_018671 [Acacia pycnantha]